MSFPLDPILFWLVGARFTGFILMAPGLNPQDLQIPGMVRVALIFWLTIIVMPFISQNPQLGPNPYVLATAVLAEVMLGMGAGMVLRWIFVGFGIGGGLIDNELSFAAAQQFNPNFVLSGGIMNRFLNVAALLYFWVLGYPALLILSLKGSFDVLPAGTIMSFNSVGELMIMMGSASFATGIMVAAPIIAVMFFVTVSLGFMARLIQGINIFFESFTVRILLGIFCVLLFLPMLLLMIRNALEQLIPTFSRYMQEVVA